MLLFIILAYFALLLGIAFYTSRHSNNESFFIGNRKSNWLLVSFGMIGTSLSGMTFISVPGTVGKGGLEYFQVAIGYWLGYFIVAYVLLPVYYRMQLTSIYTYLEARLGINAYKTGALFFILSRTLGATLRLYLVIKVLEAFVLQGMGISFELTAIVILALIVLYTLRGGVKTIVWTDTLQTTFMLSALVIVVVYMLREMGLDISSLWASMKEHNYTHLFVTDYHKPGFFLKQVIGGAFITVAMTGLDQEMMQKNISVSNLRDAKKNMLLFGFVQMVVVFIFLLLGALLYLYAGSRGMDAAGDALFPTIAVQSGLPFFITVIFLIGLVSALFPSADGALTALTSSFCIDILGLKRRNDWDEQKKAQVRYRVHFTFSAVFLLFIFFFREVDNGSLIAILLKVAGFTYGPLLGLFAFGILTRRVLKGNTAFALCLTALLLTLGLDLLNNPEFYNKDTSGYIAQSLIKASARYCGNYKIGIELLIINAALTFGLLYACSKKPATVV
ncbi:sodium:solute symporter [Rurimicrobium arvi]|uniref:Sodium:solute symporter n=1 Tax=Rurimicrobium arvi TaxID=2049916 RepID=A0ABP8MW76_9BACT